MKNEFGLVLLRTRIGRAWLPVLFLLATTATSSVLQSGDFTYTINSDNTITITHYTGPGGAAVIPSAIEGKTVTRIGGGAFGYCSSLTGVTIPASVTDIGGQAFYSCTSLTSVTIGDGVTSIGDGAFGYCTSLTSITIPNGVTSIGGSAFYSCPSLISITIGDGVTSIGQQAFAYCTSLASVTIPNGIASIGNLVFFDCIRLTSVTIPNSVTIVGDYAFTGCTSLTSITVDAGNPAYSSLDGVLFNKSQATLIQCPGGKAGNYTIPDGVTSIGDEAFYYCTSLTSVMIPTNVTSIEGFAFQECSNLTSVMIGNGVISIGKAVFFGCTSLTSVTIPASVISIGDEPFFGCTSLTAITVDTGNSVYSSVTGVLFDKSQTTLIECPGGKAGSYTIPNSVTNIVDDAFAECTSLTSVTIGNGVTSIGKEAFHTCIGLTSVTIPASVTNIGDDAFGYCTNLTEVYFKGNAPSIGSDVFWFTNNATVYYLPGTTGWGTTFGGRPTVLWNPMIAANGLGGDAYLDGGDPLMVAVAMNAGAYAGVPVDWWVVARAGSSWYYLNSLGKWTPFDGNLSHCHPVYQGALFNLPETQILSTSLPVGSYTFWFAVSYPMNGILNIGGQILVDSVNVTVQ